MNRENHDIVSFIKKFPSGYNKYKDSDNESSEEEEEEERYNTNGAKSSSFGYKIADDFFQIDGIVKREKEKVEERKSKRQRDDEDDSPQEKITRSSIINNDKHIRFLKLVAGELRLDLMELFDTEEVDRLYNDAIAAQSTMKRTLATTTEINSIKRDIAGYEREIGFTKSPVFTQFSSELPQVENEVKDYVNLLYMAKEYNVVLDVNERTEERINFLTQYYKDHEKEMTIEESKTLKDYPDILKKVCLLALNIRDVMDLAKHKYDDERGVSFLSSLQRGPVKEEKVELINGADKFVGDWVTKSGGILEQGIRLSKGSPVLISTDDKEYITLMLDMIKMLEGNDTMRHTKQMNQLQGKNLLKMHNPRLNALLGDLRDTDEIFKRCKSHFLWHFLTRSNVTIIYMNNKEGIDKILTDTRELREIQTQVNEASLSLMTTIQTTTVSLMNLMKNSGATFIKTNAVNIGASPENAAKGSLTQYFLGNVPPPELESYIEDAYTFPLGYGGDGNVDKTLAWFKFLNDFSRYSDAFVKERMDLIKERQLALTENSMYSQKRRRALQPPPSPLQTGIIALKTIVLSARQTAYDLIQEWCPALERASLDDMQSEQAIECGFAGAFARLIGATDARAALINPSSYSPKQMIPRVKEALMTVIHQIKRRYKYSGGRIVRLRLQQQNTFRSYFPTEDDY